MVRSTGYAWGQYAPHPALAAWVSAYWTLQTADGRHVVRTLPDGCIDLTLRLGRAPRAFLAGAQRRACRWTLEGRVHLIGARLSPEPPRCSASIPARCRTAGRRSTACCRGRRSPGSCVRPRGRQAAQAQVALLEAFLSERLLNRELDPRLSRALRHIFAQTGDVSVAALAKQAGAHARTLGRIFRAEVGLTPKRFMRVVRLQAALRALPGASNWAHVAATLGYHDQAHFIHDIRDLFGATPGELVALHEHTR